MCGIVGIFNHNGLPDHLRDKKLLQSMVRSLHHRGPDEQGMLFSKQAYLGHTRLSIIDLALGKQPMLEPDKTCAIVFNGEIYNYIELKQKLISKGFTFNTNSDTEVLLKMYKCYGKQMLAHLNGQFAFGIVDFINNSLFLARDRIGIRPLFYTKKKNNIVFSSSIKTICCSGIVVPEFNIKAYALLCQLWSAYEETTFLKDVYAVSPGEYIEFKNGRIDQKKYWNITFDETDHSRNEEYWKNGVREKLSEAIQLRLRSDVPVNGYLSGGLDSSIILSLTKQFHTNNVESFSVQFTDDNYDESAFQNAMTLHTGLKNHSLKITPENIGQAFIDTIKHCEQPIYRTAPIPLYYLSKLVQDNKFKVVLTGEGADEIALGYNIFKETFIRSQIALNNDADKWKKKLPGLYPYLKQFNNRYAGMIPEFYEKFVNDVDHPVFSHKIRIENGKYVYNFLMPEIKEEVQKYKAEEEIINHLPSGFQNFTHLQKAQYIEIKTLLSGYLLSSQGDRMAMAHSIEGRFPFLDHHLIEFFSKMPDSFKLNELNEKYILKEAFKNDIPQSIINRPKQPYRAPESISLLHNEQIMDSISEETIHKHGFFNPTYVSKLVKKLKQNTHNFNFNDNFSFINIAATTIFLEQFKSYSRFEIDHQSDTNYFIINIE